MVLPFEFLKNIKVRVLSWKNCKVRGHGVLIWLMYLMLFFGTLKFNECFFKKRNMWVNVVWIGGFVLALCKFKFLKTSKWEVEVERFTKSKFISCFGYACLCLGGQGRERASSDLRVHSTPTFCVNLPSFYFNVIVDECMQHTNSFYFWSLMCLHHPRLGCNDYHWDYLIIHFVIAHVIRV